MTGIDPTLIGSRLSLPYRHGCFIDVRPRLIVEFQAVGAFGIGVIVVVKLVDYNDDSIIVRPSGAFLRHTSTPFSHLRMSLFILGLSELPR